MNILLKKKRAEHFKKFIEHYPRTLTSRDAEKYCDGVTEVIDLSMLVNEVALLRNKFLSITKGLEQKRLDVKPHCET